MKCLCTATTRERLKYNEKLCTKKGEIINRREKTPKSQWLWDRLLLAHTDSPAVI